MTTEPFTVIELTNPAIEEAAHTHKLAMRTAQRADDYFNTLRDMKNISLLDMETAIAAMKQAISARDEARAELIALRTSALMDHFWDEDR